MTRAFNSGGRGSEPAAFVSKSLPLWLIPPDAPIARNTARSCRSQVVASAAASDRGRRHCCLHFEVATFGKAWCAQHFAVRSEPLLRNRRKLREKIAREVEAWSVTRSVASAMLILHGNAGAVDGGDRASRIDSVNRAMCMTGHFVSHVRETRNGSHQLRRWI